MLDERNNCYIAKISNQFYCFYYDKATECIESRQYENGKWLFHETVAKEIRDYFTLSIAGEGTLLIFCCGKDGQRRFYQNSGNGWRIQTLEQALPGAVQIHAQAAQGTFKLIYTLPSERVGIPGRRQIVCRTRNGDDWGEAEAVADNVRQISGGGCEYKLRRVRSGHYILCYQTGTHESTYGYREFTLNGRWGDFYTVYQTKHSIGPCAILPQKDAIHFSIVVKGGFTSQLIYRARRGRELTPAQVVFEAPQIEQSSLLAVGGRLYIIFSAGNYGYYQIYSEDGGQSFTRPMRLRRGYGVRYALAEYLGEAGEYEEPMMCDLFIEAENPAVSSYIEELCPEFYTLPSEMAVESGAEALHEGEGQEEALLPEMEERLAEEEIGAGSDWPGNYPAGLSSFPSDGENSGQFDLLSMDEAQMRAVFLKALSHSREEAEAAVQKSGAAPVRLNHPEVKPEVKPEVRPADEPMDEPMAKPKMEAAGVVSDVFVQKAKSHREAPSAFSAHMAAAEADLAAAGAMGADGLSGMGMMMTGGTEDLDKKPVQEQLRIRTEEIGILENKLAQAEQELLEKNQQLMDLSAEMSKRSEEYGKSAGLWREELGRLQAQLDEYTKAAEPAPKPKRRRKQTTAAANTPEEGAAKGAGAEPAEASSAEQPKTRRRRKG